MPNNNHKKKEMNKSIFSLLLLSIAGSLFVIYTLYVENEYLKDESFKKTVLIEIYKGASSGLIAASDDSKEKVKKVVDYITTNNLPKEKLFKSCWDRHLQTYDWGSMGPVGLLESCIDKISDDETAILMKKLDSSVELMRYECMPRGRTRYEGLEQCGIDGNYILLSSADNVLFKFVTEDDWLSSNTE